jgi:hypothetical protein
VFGCLVRVGHSAFVDATPSSLYKGLSRADHQPWCVAVKRPGFDAPLSFVCTGGLAGSIVEEAASEDVPPGCGDRLAGLQQLSQGVRLQGQDGAVARPV